MPAVTLSGSLLVSLPAGVTSSLPLLQPQALQVSPLPEEQMSRLPLRRARPTRRALTSLRYALPVLFEDLGPVHWECRAHSATLCRPHRKPGFLLSHLMEKYSRNCMQVPHVQRRVQHRLPSIHARMYTPRHGHVQT